MRNERRRRDGIVVAGTASAAEAYRTHLAGLIMLLPLASLLLVSAPFAISMAATVFFAISAIAALCARRAVSSAARRHVELRDLAGACALVGIAAGEFTDSEQLASVLVAGAW